MSQYLPIFNRNAKGKYNPELNLVSIKGGTDAYLLEDELNELQWIQSDAIARLTRKMAKSGCIDIPTPNSPIAPGGIIELGTDNLNTFSVKEFDSVLNGYLSHIADSYGSGTHITLPAPPIYDTRYDFVYMEFWLKELKQYDKVPRFGGYYNNPAPYEIIDSRMGLETTRRIQLQWSILVKENVNHAQIIANDLTQTYIFATGPNAAKNDSYMFSVSQEDNQMLIAGDGSTASQQGLGTLDGYVYAIPLFIIKRRNTSGYNARYNVNGGILYTGLSSVSDRPDEKFSNVVYVDDIIDIRKLSAIGQEQYNQIYTSLTEFKDYQSYMKSDIEDSLSIVVSDLNVLTLNFETEIAALKLKDDTNYATLEALHNADIIALNNKIIMAETMINDNINQQVAILDDKIKNLRQETILSIQSNVNIINTELTRVNSRIDALNTAIRVINNVDIVAIKQDIYGLNQIVEQNERACAVNQEITNNSITDIYSKIGAANIIIANHGIALAKLNLRITSLEAGLLGIKNQLASLALDGVPSDLLLYGLDMTRSNIVTAGSTLNEDGTVACAGVLQDVKFNLVSEYSVIATQQKDISGVIGDGYSGQLWAGKADTSYSLKNTGSAGITYEMFAVKNDDIVEPQYQFVWSNANSAVFPETIFAGNESTTGTRVDIPLRPDTDFIYIMPTQTYTGEVGEIYVSMDSNGFNVYNSGAAGITFEWIVIDTRDKTAGGRMRNAAVYDIAIPGYDSFASQAGDFGLDFYSVAVSTPILPGYDTAAGEIGDISVFKNNGYFTIYNTGKAEGIVRCIVFKQVDVTVGF